MWNMANRSFPLNLLEFDRSLTWRYNCQSGVLSPESASHDGSGIKDIIPKIAQGLSNGFAATGENALKNAFLRELSAGIIVA